MLILNSKRILFFIFNIFLLMLDFKVFKIIIKYTIRYIKPKEYFLVIINSNKIYTKTLDRFFVSFLWKMSLSESFELKIINKITKKNMTILDLGANVGFYTLQFAKLVGPKGKIFAFEPEPENYYLLVKNIETNNYKNITPVRKAVSDKTGKIKLFICEENRGDHRIFDSEGKRDSIEIETIKLDDFIPKEQRIDIIKMDIQGSEYLAFLGMKKTVERNNRLIIIMEFSPYLIKKCGFSPKALINKIIEYGFKIYIIDEKKKSINPINYSGLLKICDETKLSNFKNLYLEKNIISGN